MNHWWIVVVAVIGSAGALPMKTLKDTTQLMEIFSSKELGRNNAIENIIIDTLEGVRVIMTMGTDIIPVLDPFQLSRIYIDDAIIPFPGVRLEATDITVSNLSTFVIKEVTVTSTSIILQRYRAVIEIEVPQINVDAENYDFFVRVWGLNLFGNGEAKTALLKPWVRVNTEVNIRLGLGAIYLNIRDLRIDFGLPDIEVGLTGVFNDTSVDDFVNRFLRNLILEMLEYYSEYISDIISPIARDIANNFLSDFNLIDIIG